MVFLVVALTIGLLAVVSGLVYSLAGGEEDEAGFVASSQRGRGLVRVGYC